MISQGIIRRNIKNIDLKQKLPLYRGPYNIRLLRDYFTEKIGLCANNRELPNTGAFSFETRDEELRYR